MPIVVISQAAHSGAEGLALELGLRLGFPVVGRREAAAEARRYGVSEEELEQGLGTPAGVFERFTRRKQRYLLALQAALGVLFEEGNGIYHGLAGQFLFRGLDGVLQVHVVAPLEDRATTAGAALGLERREAIRRLEAVDERRAKWGRQLFGIDVTDHDLYDVVVNLGQVDVVTAAAMAADMVRRTEVSPEAGARLRDFALTKRIEGALCFNSPFASDTIDVSATDGVVHLAGGRTLDRERERVIAFVGGLRGVERVVVDELEVPALGATLDLDIGLGTGDTTAREVMLAPDSYPHCSVDCSIREAIVALSASAVRLQDGHLLLPRYVLVLDDDSQLVGIVSRRELLRGLVPRIRELEEAEEHIRRLAPFTGASPEPLVEWTSFFTRAAVEASRAKVATIMAPIKGAVQVDDTLSTVISTMLALGVDLVPVLDGRRVAGVVLMTNIFDLVAQFVVEHGGSLRSGDGQ